MLRNIETESSYKSVKLDSFRNKVGELVYQQEILYTSSQKTLKELTDSLNLKVHNAQFANHTTTNTIIDSIFIPYKEPITAQEKQDSCIKVPKTFALSGRWWAIKGRVELLGTIIDSINIKDEVYMVINQHRHGFLNLKRENVITILHKNPDVHVINSQTLQYKVPPTVFKWVIPISSAIIGSFLTYKLMK